LVENPGYIFMRESAAIMEENYKSFHQEEGIIIVQAIIDNLSRRHSVSESPRSMEEGTTPPRRNDTLLLGGMRATQSSSMRLDVRRSRPSDLTARHDHPLHLHTLCGIPMGLSSRQRRRRRSSLALSRGL
jgi:hypothetical protein